MTYQFEFLSHIYGEEVKNSFGVYIKSGAKLEEDNTIMSILKGNLPEKTNIEIHDHFEQRQVESLLQKIKETECKASKCLADRREYGFYKPGNTPWIGYPNLLEV